MIVEGKQRMKEYAVTSFVFQWPCPLDLLLGPSQIEIGCVLN